MADHLVSLVVVSKHNDSIAQNLFCGRGALGELFEREVPVGLDLSRLAGFRWQIQDGKHRTHRRSYFLRCGKTGGIKCYGALQDIVNRAEDLWPSSRTSKDLVCSWLYLVDSTKKDEVR